MNLIKNHILEIHSETKRHPYSLYIDVDLTYDCYGLIKRDTITFYVPEWEKARKNGYFLA